MPTLCPPQSASAREALPGWSRLGAPSRGEFLFRAAELLLDRASSIGSDLTREEGKTIGEATGEVRRAAAILRYFAGRTADPDRMRSTHRPRPRLWIQTVREPIGVVAIDHPVELSDRDPDLEDRPGPRPTATRSYSSRRRPRRSPPSTLWRRSSTPVSRPASSTSSTCRANDLGRQWVAGSGIAGLSFTGSAPTGRRLADQALGSGVKVQLELGGKNAVVVAADADLELAADAIMRGAFASAGQKCTATSRAIAVRDIAIPLREALVDRVSRLLPGNPLEPSTNLGPVIDLAARDRIAALVAAARTDGARVAGRSTAHEIEQIGAFAPALVLDRVDPGASIARDEVFGPVLVLLEADDLDQAIRIHNDVAYGLSGSLFTRSLANADRFVRTARVGIVHVNGETAGAEPHVPFGGMKASSSWSREQGHAAEDFYTQTKTIYWDGLADIGPFDLG
ncbi:MAG: aldehyde dehydrogenase family protein [Candidatus Limnocylindrales bacterium]